MSRCLAAVLSVSNQGLMSIESTFELIYMLKCLLRNVPVFNFERTPKKICATAFKKYVQPLFRHTLTMLIGVKSHYMSTTSYHVSVSVKKMGEGGTGGASDMVKAESSGVDPRATGGLIFDLSYPRVIKTKQHTNSFENTWTKRPGRFFHIIVQTYDVGLHSRIHPNCTTCESHQSWDFNTLQHNATNCRTHGNALHHTATCCSAPFTGPRKWWK